MYVCMFLYRFIYFLKVFIVYTFNCLLSFVTYGLPYSRDFPIECLFTFICMCLLFFLCVRLFLCLFLRYRCECVCCVIVCLFVQVQR